MAATDIFRIGVDQAPRTGSHYPFIGGLASNLLPLLQDLYLSYPPGEGNTASTQNSARFAYPFRVSMVKLPEVEGDLTWEQIALLWEDWNTNWETDLTGTVTRVGPVVVDADDEVVFDPVAEGASYHVAPWGVDRLLVEWIGVDKVMRLVVSVDGMTLFEDEDEGDEYSILDPRTYTQVNSGVKSLFAGTMYATEYFEIEAGYNMRIDVEPSEGIDGTRRVHRLSFNAVAGAGEGKTPGCAGEIDFITSLNNQLPDASGRIRLDTDDCYRFQTPVSLSGGLATVTPNALRLFSACGPRCPPDYYVNVYRGISKLWFHWQDIATELTQARDDFVDSVSRWNIQRECRRNNPAKMIVLPEPNCRLAISAVYCNAGKACLIPLEFRFTFEVLSGSPTSTPSLCGPAVRNGSSLDIEESVVLQGAWPQWRTTFDYLDPQRSANVQFRICIPGCTGKQVRVTMTVHSPTTGNSEESVILSGPTQGSAFDTRASVVNMYPLNASTTIQGGVCNC